MKLKSLGNTGVQVSELCFGTMSFGGDADKAESAAMFARCRDAGINFFDCADAYVKGQSEIILGELIKGSRNELVITSKCFMSMPGDGNLGGGNRRHIIAAVEASLKRLGTDRIDVHFMHRWDPVVPLEETLRALEQLVQDGKVLYLGASNYAAWQIAKGLGISQRNGWSRFDVIQPMYSLVKRQAEAEIFPLALAEDLGVITYSAAGGGLLSGKYGKTARPDSGRIMTNQEYVQRYSEDWVFETAEAFTEFANAQGIHPVSLAVAWAASHPSVTCPIIGARNIEQLEPSLNAIDVGMTPQLREEIAALSRTPPPATDRLEEQLREQGS
ncbi:MAG: aldo/keto reductase [Pseudomonadota bacterium]